MGIAVASLDESIALYETKLEMPLVHRETVPAFGVEAVLFDVGESHVELISPLDEESGVAKFIAANGPGLHHVAYAVDDIEAALERIAGAGIDRIDEQPRTGIRQSRVAFLHPRSTGGVLTEIVEPAGGH